MRAVYLVFAVVLATAVANKMAPEDEWVESEAADAGRTEAANARQLDLIEESKGRAEESKGRASEDEFTLEPPGDDEDLAQSSWNPFGAQRWLSLLASVPNSIYFVGNSYTIRANLELDIKRVANDRLGLNIVTGGRARHGGQLKDTFNIERRSRSDNAFSGLWNTEDGKRVRAPRCPSVVVLQEQSIIGGLPDSSYQQYRGPVYDFIKTFWGPKAKACRTTIAWYQTWGKRNGDATYGWPTFEAHQTALINGVGRYAKATSDAGANVITVKVGEAFQRVKGERSNLFYKLYKRDGSHPSPGAGAYLINQVFFSTLFASKAAEWQYVDESTWRPADVSLDEAKYLATVACSIALGLECNPATQKPQGAPPPPPRPSTPSAPPSATSSKACNLAYCNANIDLKNHFCGGQTCTTDTQATRCLSHWNTNGKKEGRPRDPVACTQGPSTPAPSLAPAPPMVRPTAPPTAPPSSSTSKSSKACNLAYCNAHVDLRNHYCGQTCTTDKQARRCLSHWNNFGKKEGRSGDPVACVGL